MEVKDIEKLAKLARIELTEKEKETYLKEIGGILHYVDQIKEVVSQVGEERKAGDLRNIMRADDGVSDPSCQPVDLIVEFPQKDGDYLKVKKILGS